MWYFAWILGVSMAVLLASMAATMCDAKDCALDATDRGNAKH
jgi:cyd operon protein YbgT